MTSLYQFYNPANGVATVPPGGDGMYAILSNITLAGPGTIDLLLNGNVSSTRTLAAAGTGLVAIHQNLFSGNTIQVRVTTTAGDAIVGGNVDIVRLKL